MTLEEMRAEFRQAKDPKEQIVIIADQALMTPYEVATMLREAGEDVDRRWFAQKKNWQKEETKEETRITKEEALEALKEAVKRAKEQKKEEDQQMTRVRQRRFDVLELVDAIIRISLDTADIFGVDAISLAASTLVILMVPRRGERK